MAHFMNFNGNVQVAESPPLPGAVPFWTSYEGIFETMRIMNGKILHEEHHFKRLFDGLRAIRFEIPQSMDATYFSNCIIELCKKNGQEKSARVRLAVFKNDSPENENAELGFAIESWELNNEYVFDENGLIIGIYPHATRQANEVSLYKTTGYFPYRFAADYARAQALGDCLLMNTYRRVCDSSISNIFWVKDQVVHTPPLTEGCIDGTMRKYLMEKLPAAGFAFKEQPVTLEILRAADEVFLTNIIRGIRPVRQFQQSNYGSVLTREIFTKVVAPLTKS